MQAAIATVVARHEALRYSFEECAGTLRALVNEPGAFRVEIERLPRHARSSRGMCRLPWPRSSPACPRSRVNGSPAPSVLEPGGEGLAVLVFHHIIGDGASLGIINEELSLLLAGEKRLPDCAFQFSDFAAWERECVRGEMAERLAAFWVDWLATIPRLRLQELLWVGAGRPRGLRLRLLRRGGIGIQQTRQGSQRHALPPGPGGVLDCTVALVRASALPGAIRCGWPRIPGQPRPEAHGEGRSFTWIR